MHYVYPIILFLFYFPASLHLSCIFKLILSNRMWELATWYVWLLKSPARSAGYPLFSHYQLNADSQIKNLEILVMALNDCRTIKLHLEQLLIYTKYALKNYWHLESLIYLFCFLYFLCKNEVTKLDSGIFILQPCCFR